MPADAPAFVSELKSHTASREDVLQATRHLSKRARQNLFATDPLRRGISRGQLFESIVYDLIVDVAQTSKDVSRYVLTRADVPWERRNPVKQDRKDGFLYDAIGQILLRGDWVDLGEYDSLVFEREGRIWFVESKASKDFLKGFVETFSKKRRFLRILFGHDPTLLMVSPDDIAGTSVGRELVRESSCYFVRTPEFPKVMEDLSATDLLHVKTSRRDITKGVFADDLKVSAEFNLGKVHDELRDQIINSLRSGDMKEARDLAESQPLLPRLRLGQLGRESMGPLIRDWTFTVGDSRIEKERLLRTDGIRLLLSLPDLRPGLYFAFKHNQHVANQSDQRVFIKFGPVNESEFGCERVIFPWSTPFFHSLDDEHALVWPDLLNRVMKTCITQDVIGLKAHVRRREESEVINELFGKWWTQYRMERLSK